MFSPPSTSGPVLQGSVCRTGPAAPRAEGSVDPSVVGLPVHVEIRFDKVCGDGLLVQRVGGLRVRQETGSHTAARDESFKLYMRKSRVLKHRPCSY